MFVFRSQEKKIAHETETKEEGGKMKDETFKKQIEAGKWNTLLRVPTSQDNQETRKRYRKAFQAFAWRCLESTQSLHRKEERAMFQKLLDEHCSGGLLAVWDAWVLQHPTNASQPEMQ